MNVIYPGLVQLYCLPVFDGGAVGTIHDHEASVVTERRKNGANTVVGYLFVRPLSEDEKGAIQTALIPFRTVPEFDQKDTLVRLPFSDVVYTHKVRERVDRTLIAAGEAFKTLGLVQYEGCALCEQPGFDRRQLVRGIAMRTHDACYDKLMADVAEHYRKLDSSTERLGKGYVWAIAGMFLGGFVKLMITLLTDFAYSALYAFIAVAALGFYRLAQAPLRKEIPYVMAVLSVLSTVVVILLIYWTYASSWGLTLSAFLIDGIPEEPDVMTYFIQEIFYGSFACVVAVSIMWSLFLRARHK